MVPEGTPGRVWRHGGLGNAHQHVVSVGSVGPDAGLDDPLGLLGLGAEQDALREQSLAETGDHPALIDGRDIGRVEVDGNAGEGPEVHLGQG